MTPERFGELAQTYGAQLKRWPADEREAAASLLRSGRVEIDALLDDAARVDQWLDSYRVAPAGSALTQAIVNVAPSPWFGFGLPAWWSGLGVAGVALAGVLAGAIFVPTAMSDFASGAFVSNLSASNGATFTSTSSNASDSTSTRSTSTVPTMTVSDYVYAPTVFGAAIDTSLEGGEQ